MTGAVLEVRLDGDVGGCLMEAAFGWGYRSVSSVVMARATQPGWVVTRRAIVASAVVTDRVKEASTVVISSPGPACTVSDAERTLSA